MKLRNRILACLLASLTVLSGTAPLAARAQSEQGGAGAAAPAGTKGYPSQPAEEGHAFLVTMVNGAAACRDATPLERLQILRRDPSVKTRPVRGGESSPASAPQPEAAASDPAGSNLTAGHLDIVLRPTEQLRANPEALAAFERAAATWENLITSEITVVVDVDFGATRFGTAFGTNVIGSTAGGLVYVPPYSDVRNRLVQRASTAEESGLYSVLPAGANIPAESGTFSSMRVSSPQARALGAIAPHANPDDTTGNDKLGNAPSVGFNTAYSFDFDPANGISAGKIDFDAVVTHELGHALGFVSDVGILEVAPTATQRPTVWDLFRFRPGTTFSTFQTAPRVVTTGGEQRYFDGALELPLSTGNPAGNNGDGEQASHWKDDRLNGGFYVGIMDPTINSGIRRQLTDGDRRAIDFMGYSLGALPPGPANDRFADAVTLQGPSGSVTGTNVNARKEAGEPDAIPGQTAGGRSVWYAWAAPASGTATFDTVGSDFDTTLSVFNGAAVTALLRVADNDDITRAQDTASRVVFPVTAGTVYRIMVDGFDGDSGGFALNWTSSAPTPTPTPTPTVSYSISGRVQDAAGNGLQGVRVALDGPNLVNTFPHLPVTTDAGGNFQFSLLTPGGNYTVRPDDSRYAFSPAAAAFNAISSNQAGLTFTASPSSVPLTGRVVEGGQGLAGALVGLHDNNGGFLQQTSTGPDGRWALSVGVNRGYHLTFLKPGYTLSPLGFPIQVGVSAYDVGEVTAVKANRIEETSFFVAQHYRDFLGREPDAGGLNFWINEIEGCGVDTGCREVKRINVSAAFFQSIEFQNTGYLVERMYKAAYGDRTESSTGLVVPAVTREEFMQDAPLISDGVVVNQLGWESKLESNKAAYAQTFVGRPRFANAFGALTPAQFVGRLDANAGLVLTAAERAALTDELAANNTAAGRAAVLRKVAENAELDRREKNRAFVLMQYFGYLRRNPSDAPEANLNYAGWNFWLTKLNEFNGNFVAAELVKAFLDSTEYRRRFAQ